MGFSRSSLVYIYLWRNWVRWYKIYQKKLLFFVFVYLFGYIWHWCCFASQHFLFYPYHFHATTTANHPIVNCTHSTNTSLFSSYIPTYYYGIIFNIGLRTLKDEVKASIPIPIRIKYSCFVWPGLFAIWATIQFLLLLSLSPAFYSPLLCWSGCVCNDDVLPLCCWLTIRIWIILWMSEKQETDHKKTFLTMSAADPAYCMHYNKMRGDSVLFLPTAVNQRQENTNRLESNWNDNILYGICGKINEFQ